MTRGSRKGNVCGNAPLVAAFVALAVGLAGCSGEDPAVRKAREAFSEQAGKNADHAEYAASIAVAAPSPETGAVVLALIQNENNQIARAAVKAIVDDPPAEAEEALRSLFQTRRGLLKLDAAIALARLGDAEALAWVKEEVLKGSGGSMTLPAFKLLAAQGEQEALTPIVTSRMESDEPSIRNEAYVFLGEADQSWATQLLVQGLGNEFGAEREQAIVSIGATGEPGAAPFVEKFLNTRGLVFASIETLGELGNPDSVSKLKGPLESDTSLVRLYAAAAIWKLGDEETALTVLEPLVSDESADLRQSLAQQISGIDSPKASEFLVRLAADEDAQVRLEAIRALGAREHAAGHAQLMTALADKSYQVQTSALDGLASYGTAEAVPQIEPLLDNRNPYVAMSAANAILAIKGRDTGAA